MRHALYRSAKADPERRLHALQDKVHRGDVLWRAWAAVRCNHGVDRLLGEVAGNLREGRWRPLPARRVFIPEPGTVEQHPLSITSVGDRVLQAV